MATPRLDTPRSMFEGTVSRQASLQFRSSTGIMRRRVWSVRQGSHDMRILIIEDEAGISRLRRGLTAHGHGNRDGRRRGGSRANGGRVVDLVLLDIAASLNGGLEAYPPKACRAAGPRSTAATACAARSKPWTANPDVRKTIYSSKNSPASALSTRRAWLNKSARLSHGDLVWTLSQPAACWRRIDESLQQVRWRILRTPPGGSTLAPANPLRHAGPLRPRIERRWTSTC